MIQDKRQPPVSPPNGTPDSAALSWKAFLPVIILGCVGVASLVAMGLWAWHAAGTEVREPVTKVAVQPVVALARPESSPAPQAEAEPASAPTATTPAFVDDKVEMAKAPDPAISEETPEGVLPVIAEDGRKPWQVYSRPFSASGPRVAVVLGGLGISKINTNAALERLTGAITLAFDAQSAELATWMGKAREDGHETLLAVPMEPFDYPRSDPGTGTLLTTLSNQENLARLKNALRRASGYVGVTTLSGGKFSTTPRSLKPVLGELHDRGLLFFDAKAAPMSAAGDLAHQMGMPKAESALRLDQELTPAAIDAALAQLTQRAQQAGKAAGFAVATPLVIERLDRWSRQLHQSGVVLAPVSAVVE